MTTLSQYTQQGFKKLLPLFIFLWLTTGVAFAQGSITGRVADPSSSAIPNASVRVTNNNTGVVRSASTNDDGYFTVPALPQGVFTVSVDASGFSKTTRTDVHLDQDQSLRLDLSLALGEVQSTVEVTSQAPALERETSQVNTTLESEPIRDLPLNGRNTTALVGLSPAVRPIGAFGSYTQSANTDGRISIAGAPPSFNSFLVDGTANELHTSGGPMTDLSPDATEQIAVVTHNAPAEYGRTGGGIINTVSKSGTNSYHGSAWTYVQDSGLNANNWFSKNQGKPIPPLKFYQYGTTFGGPIIHQKTFFFFNWEGSKQTLGSNVFYTVPTAAERQGIFSGITKIFDPVTGSASADRTEFSNDTIPMSRLNPVAVAIASYYPQPNVAGNPTTNNYFANGTQYTSRNQFGFRADHYFTPTQQLAARYTYDKATLVSPFYFGGPTPSPADPGFGPTVYGRKGAAITYTNALTPHLLVEGRIGFNRFGIDRVPISQGFDTTKINFPSYLNTDMQLQEFPRFTFSQTSAIGSNQSDPVTQRNNAYSGGGSITWIRGQHTWKVGGEARVYQWFSIQGTGVLQFNFDANFSKGPSPTAAATNGFDFASFLLGSPASATLTRHENYAYTTKYGAGYLQDDWKVTPKLVVNYGVRYEHEGATTDRFNRISNFDPNATYLDGGINLTGGLIYPGLNTISRGDRNSTFDHFAPRVGIAYSARSTTVIRAAYGLFYLPTTGGFTQLGSTGFSSQTAYVATIDGNQPSGSLSNPFPQGIVPITGSSLGPLTGLGTSIAGNTRALVSGASQQFSANLQQQIGLWTIQFGYLGNHGLHLPADYAYHHLPQTDLTQGNALLNVVANPYSAIIKNGSLSAATIQQGQLEMNYPQFTGVTSMINWAGSNYNAGTVQVQRNFVKGFSLLASYTWSKLLDNNLGNGENAFADTGSNTVQNWDNLRAEKAVSTSNLPNRLVLSSTFLLPVGQNGSRMYRALLGGWQLNGIFTAESGNVISVTANAASYGGARPNLIGNPSLANPGPNQWLNATAFQNIPAFTYGNAPRTLPNTRTQAYVNLDGGLVKGFTVHDRYHFDLRMEAFNSLNSTTFGIPDSNINDKAFGRITTLRTGSAPRVLQFAFKSTF